ncbi:MAG: spore coat protein CotH, partial [Lachnospiraceae bacterium]|nr:spore coat protein CotH [Lachnospiraceae bacterium]
MKKTNRVAGVLLGILMCGMCGCSRLYTAEAVLVDEDETYEKEQHDSVYEQLTDRASWYEGEGEPEVSVLYLTVGKGSAEAGTDHTWAEVNARPLSWYEENGIKPYRCEAVLQEGGETGPLAAGFGYGERVANATVCLRGSGASGQPQKSYRIDIKKGKGKWDGQKTVLLNKHAADPVRFKNRLAYSLMQEIPSMFSARTRFVHLYVKDKTEGEDGLFRDYGLYTAVEQINKTYLKNHGLDNGGQLYQAEEFDWGLHEDSLVPATSPQYDDPCEA